MGRHGKRKGGQFFSISKFQMYVVMLSTLSIIGDHGAQRQSSAYNNFDITAEHKWRYVFITSNDFIEINDAVAAVINNMS